MKRFCLGRISISIKRDTLIEPKDKGNLELPDCEIVTKSLQFAWVKRMEEEIKPSGWKSRPLTQNMFVVPQ